MQSFTITGDCKTTIEFGGLVGTITCKYTIHVTPATPPPPSPLKLTPGDPANPTALPSEQELQPATPTVIKITGGVPPYNPQPLAPGSLPAGVTASFDGIDQITISGTPNAGTAADYALDVTVNDSAP